MGIYLAIAALTAAFLLVVAAYGDDRLTFGVALLSILAWPVFWGAFAWHYVRKLWGGTGP